MLRRLAPIVVVSVLAVALWAGTRVTRAAALPPLVNLTPGGDLRIQQTVDVNVVLIGFNGLVDPATLLAQSPVPAWNGVPQANGSGQTFIRQRFDFRYHLTMAPAWFENALFPFLRAVAVPQAPIPIIPGLPDMPISPFQAIYNYCNVHPAFDPSLGCSVDPAAPRVNARFITQNYLLDAAFVEKVLSQNLSSLAVDVAKPTVVLLNWWGRPDYVDHIYLDPSEPDPETGAPRGLFFINELAGYGATSQNDPETCLGDCIHHRLWFHDLSAGPMGRTGGIDLVAAVNRFVVGGFAGGVNYRFHHTADYGTTSGTYRPLNTLNIDVARLIGAVFVSQIAYAGPVYPPGITPPRQPHDLVLDINRWSWNGESFAGLLDVPYMISKMNALPYNFRAEVTEQPDSLDSRLGDVWKCSLTSGRAEQLGQSCYGNRYGGFALADLQAYFTDHLFQFIDGAPDYELPIFQFNVSPPLNSPFFAGLAASNYMLPKFNPTELPNTRQTFIFTSTTPLFNADFGHGHLLQHEVGHHLGFSHPFQGYRCLTETCGTGEFVPFGGNASTFFSFAGQYLDRRDVVRASQQRLQPLRARQPAAVAVLAVPRSVELHRRRDCAVPESRFGRVCGPAGGRAGRPRARRLSGLRLRGCRAAVARRVCGTRGRRGCDSGEARARGLSGGPPESRGFQPGAARSRRIDATRQSQRDVGRDQDGGHPRSRGPRASAAHDATRQGTAAPG